jgi:hypothetical protein
MICQEVRLMAKVCTRLSADRRLETPAEYLNVPIDTPPLAKPLSRQNNAGTRDVG